ncbi:exodeoxyribonuclease VII small subunit [Candidatus Binatia bacterium]|nr:exodeoxyribonuclease VII small subunit [Candidatus Binatia bacterium]
MTNQAQETPPQRFDEALAELERLVGQLERGDLPLEAALATFETGVTLVRQLSEALSAAEARVEVLTRDSDGTLRRNALPGDADGKT